MYVVTTLGFTGFGGLIGGTGGLLPIAGLITFFDIYIPFSSYQNTAHINNAA